MATAVIHLDWLGGENSVVEIGNIVTRARRSCLITNITPDNPGIIPDLRDRGSNYYRQIGMALPRLGTPHPEYGDLLLRDRRVVAIDPANARADLIYQTVDSGVALEPSVLRTTSTLASRVVMPTDGGVPVTVAYNTPQGTLEQAVELQLRVPVRVREYRRKEISALPDLDPMFEVTGFVNLSEFPGPPPNGDPPGTWLCTGIFRDMTTQTSLFGANSEGLGGTLLPVFDVVYVFEHDANGWGQQFRYIDPGTGRPPPDLDLVVGEKIFDADQIYPAADFNGLGLGWDGVTPP